MSINPETIYSDETSDPIGSATYSDNGRSHYRATSTTGRARRFTCRAAAVAWLNMQYDSTH